MRITIDTDLQAIIVPESYYMQVDKLNEVIEEAAERSWIIRSISRAALKRRIIRRLSVRTTWRR